MSTSLRRLRRWAASVQWFAVLAITALLVSLALAMTDQSSKLITVTAAAGITLAVLALRED